MKSLFCILMACIMLAGTASLANAQNPLGGVLDLIKVSRERDGVIQLPIRFHIVRGAEMTKKGVALEMWLTPEDVRERILPEINRIWQPAGIQWVIESVVEDDIAQVRGRRRLVEDISVATRETSDRTTKIRKLIDVPSHHPAIHNVYFFPYVGETTQGFATFGGSRSVGENPDGGNHCVMGVWTDKPSRAKKPPQRFKMSEGLPFKRGSIGRTCAHELGHNLLLQHPDKETQTVFDRVMGGRRPGYALTPEEIKLARTVAVGRAKTIVKWARKRR